MFSFRGRIRRRTWWGWNLFTAAIALPVMGLLWPFLMTSALRADLPTVHEPRITPLGMFVFPAIFIVLIWIGLALGAKRCHDRGKSGWWMLVGAIPVIGGIWALVDCGCLSGNEGANAYGPDPA